MVRIKRRAKAVFLVAGAIVAVVLAPILTSLVLSVTAAFQLALGVLFLGAVLLSVIVFPRYWWREFKAWLREQRRLQDEHNPAMLSPLQTLGVIVGLLALWGFAVWYFHYR